MELLGNGTKMKTASICKEDNFFLSSNCSSSFVSDSEYTVKDNNTINIQRKGRNIEVLPEEYLPTRDGVYICVTTTEEEANEYAFQKTLWDIENTVARTLLIISIICEVVLIITYVSINELMNTPGKMIVTISTLLLLTDAIVSGMYAATLTHDTCRIVAPIMHWLALSLYLWTSLLAHDLWKTFRKSFARRSDESKEFVKLFVFVSSVSSIIVGLALMLEHSTTFVVGYGKIGENACWMTTYDGRLYLFLIASYVTLLLTIVFLILIITSIRRNMEPSVATPQHHVNLPTMVLKLSLVLGVVDIISLVEVYRAKVYISTILIG